MTFSLWKWVVFGAILLVVLGIGAYASLRVYIQQRNQGWLEEADAAYEAGEWQLAKNYYERYIPQDKENLDLLIRYADACQRLQSNRVGALQSAAVSYLQILTFHPDKIEYRSVLLDLYKKMGSWGDVEYYATEWQNDDPDNRELKYNHALALDRLGRRDDAIAEYRNLVAEGTEYSDAYASLANLLRDRGLENEASAVFRDALERHPENARILVDHARFLARDRDWERVESILNEAFALAPDDPQVRVAMAQTAGLRDNYDAVIEHLRHAITTDPENPAPHLLLAGAYVAMDDLSRAVDTLKNVDPLVQVDNPAILITLGDLQLSLRRFEDAKNTLMQYSDAYPGQLPVEEYFAAKELLVQGEPREAIERLSPVLELRPNFLQARFTLVVAYLEVGERELARNALDAYLAMNPSDVRARDLLFRNFGEPISLEATVARAGQILNDENANSESLYAAGAALFEMAQRADQLDQHTDTARKLLRRCIEKDPKRTGAYETLIALELTDDETRAAAALLDEALEAGVPEEDLARSRVAVALEQGEEELAQTVVDESLAMTSTPSVDAYLDWAGFLASRNAYANAILVIDKGIQAVTTDREKTELTLAKVSLAANHGNLDDAIALLTEVEAAIPASSPMRGQLNATRLELVQHLLATPDRPENDIVQSMVAEVRVEDPDNPVLNTIDGFMLLRQEPPDVAGAKALFERAVKTEPRDVNVQWGLASIAMLEQDYPRALAHAERAAALAPELSALQLQLGEIYSMLGRRLDAEKALTRVLDDDPRNVRALHLLAASLIERKELRRAREVLTRLENTETGGQDTAASLRTLRGRLHLLEGDSAEAERILRAQVEDDPDRLEPVYDLAMTVHRRGRTDEAVQLIEQWARNHPAEPEGWVSVARLYQVIGGDVGLEKASTSLTRALVADPQFVPALREMLSVRIQQGNLGEAIGLCDRYLEKYPDSADVLNTKALLLLESPGQLDIAGSVIERTIALDGSPEYIATRGMIFLAKGDPRRALDDLLAAAAAMSPTTARIDLALAEAYYATRDLSTAREYYQSAVQKSTQGEAVNRGRLARMGELLNSQDTAA
jgi:tetratricopeptide (TPR) repeat protein